MTVFVISVEVTSISELSQQEVKPLIWKGACLDIT